MMLDRVLKDIFGDADISGIAPCDGLGRSSDSGRVESKLVKLTCRAQADRGAIHGRPASM